MDSGSGDIEGISGKTTDEMLMQETYSGWDFDNIWAMSEYPHFQIIDYDTPSEQELE